MSGDAEPGPTGGNQAWRLLVGAVLIASGAACLWRVYAGSGESHMLTGALLALAGLAEGLHGVVARSWRGFVVDLGPALLFLLAGLVIFVDPIAGSFFLSIGLVVFVAGGVVLRLLSALDFGERAGRRALLATGIVAALAVLALLLTWPRSGILVLDSVAAAGLFFAGLSWLSMIRQPARARAG
jgi:uncharacterized membrane protein HdeD (DUF308 family)